MLTNHILQGVAGNPVVPMSEFFNSKLTSKANRQMQGTVLLYRKPKIPLFAGFTMCTCMCIVTFAFRSSQCNDWKFPSVAEGPFQTLVRQHTLGDCG